MTPIRSDLLDNVTHGFFTREGGVSTGLYASLNTGQGSRDALETVEENRQRIAGYLGAEALLSVHQIHSARVVTITSPWSGQDRPEADAMVTATPGLAIGVLSADCTPVLFADREACVIGAAHAGWKGALGGVLESTLDAMVALGADRGTIVAAVGPTISQRAYEVGPEFVERFLDEDHAFGRFFSGGQGDRAMFDLPGFCLHRLREAGVAEAAWTGHCTYSAPKRFSSYRRSCHQNEPDYGRLLSAIML